MTAVAMLHKNGFKQPDQTQRGYDHSHFLGKGDEDTYLHHDGRTIRVLLSEGVCRQSKSLAITKRYDP